MHKIIFIITLIFISCFSLTAQNEVTKFLGIPIDGSKTEMISKLKAKGYTPTSFDKEILEGEFNGLNVFICIVTNNNKVYRIFVSDKNKTSEAQIKTIFNNLFAQFKANSRYDDFGANSQDFPIPESENLRYEMLVNKKQYQANFIQNPNYPGADKRLVWFTIGNSGADYNILMFYDNLNNMANGDDL